MSDRTFRIPMRGADVEAWQHVLNDQLRTWRVPYAIPNDGVYGAVTRSMTATVLHGLGIPLERMRHGVTPELRVKVRHKRLSVSERARYAARAPWRRRLAQRYANHLVAAPLGKILAHSWGYHPPVHDGVDLICLPDAPVFAICKARVIDVRAGGWWGKAPSGDVAKGDGIIQLESLVDVGPFRRGMHFGYGHAEKARVRVGDVVEAGQRIGHAGLAVAWHIHLMVNDGQTMRGVGTRDPWPFVAYALKNP